MTVMPAQARTVASGCQKALPMPTFNRERCWRAAAFFALLFSQSSVLSHDTDSCPHATSSSEVKDTQFSSQQPRRIHSLTHSFAVLTVGTRGLPATMFWTAGHVGKKYTICFNLLTFPIKCQVSN